MTESTRCAVPNSKQPLVVAVLVALTVALTAAPAQAGQVVYERNGEIWLMNDDGSGQRKLAGIEHVPGTRELATPTFGVAGPGSANALRVAFTGRQRNTTGSSYCGVNCSGIYLLDDGQISRATGAPGGNCGGSCASFNEEPELGPDSAELYYERSSAVASPPAFSSSVAVLPVGGSADTLPSSCDVEDPTPSPVDARVAYVCGSSLHTTGADRGSASDDVLVAQDDAPIRQPAFSPDGTEVVEAEGGSEPGLWRVAVDGSGFLHVLASPGGTAFHSPRYTDNGFVFTAGGDVWWVSNACSAATCSFPADATRLTSSGGVSGLGWTAADGQVTAAGASVDEIPQPGPAPGADSDGDGVPSPQDRCPNEAGQPPTGCRPGVKDGLDGTPDNPLMSASAKARRKGKKRSIRVRVRLSRAARVEVAVGRIVKRRRAGRRVEKVIAVGKKTFDRKAGTATLTLKTVAGRRLRAGRYRLRIRAIDGETRYEARSLTVRVR